MVWDGDTRTEAGGQRDERLWRAEGAPGGPVSARSLMGSTAGGVISQEEEVAEGI